MACALVNLLALMWIEHLFLKNILYLNLYYLNNTGRLLFSHEEFIEQLKLQKCLLVTSCLHGALRYWTELYDNWTIACAFHFSNPIFSLTLWSIFGWITVLSKLELENLLPFASHRLIKRFFSCLFTFQKCESLTGKTLHILAKSFGLPFQISVRFFVFFFINVVKTDIVIIIQRMRKYLPAAHLSHPSSPFPKFHGPWDMGHGPWDILIFWLPFCYCFMFVKFLNPTM